MKIKAQCFSRNVKGEIIMSSDIFDYSRVSRTEDRELLFDWELMLTEENGVVTSYVSHGSDRNPVWSCAQAGHNTHNLKFVE